MSFQEAAAGTALIFLCDFNDFFKVESRKAFQGTFLETDFFIRFVKNWNQNTVRAFHKNFSETKYFYVISGAVKFVLVDDRQKSPTYQQKDTFVLTSEKPAVLIVPPKVYNGWKALTDEAVLLGIANTTMKEHRDERVAHDSFGVNWR